MTPERRSDWTDTFRAWIASLSPKELADLLDVLVLELQRRHLGDHDALQQATDTVREHRAVRVQKALDSFSGEKPPRSQGGDERSPGTPNAKPA
jgi:hypothetical protein